MAENNQNAVAGSAPAKQNPVVTKGGVYKPPVERADANPYKDSRISSVGAWLQERFSVVIPVIDYLKKKEVQRYCLFLKKEPLQPYQKVIHSEAHSLTSIRLLV